MISCTRKLITIFPAGWNENNWLTDDDAPKGDICIIRFMEKCAALGYSSVKLYVINK